ncbi:MAG TPA: hypothetical protein VF465_03040 [Flavobacterium sp.]|uniref:hypothetical protein n=1 Tax=Flavobacterium sp. TaxID=239 RepID=UPI002ED1D643
MPHWILKLEANSGYPLYLLWLTPPQEDVAAIRTRAVGFMGAILGEVVIFNDEKSY